MKKIISAVLFVAIILGVSGCNVSIGDNSEVPVIEWYLMKAVDNPSSLDMVEEELNAILAERVGAKLNLNLIDPGSWMDRMNVIINSSENFDICQTSSTGATSVARNARTDSFLDIKDLLQEYGQDILAKQDPRVWDGVTFDGKVLAIPSQGKYINDYGLVFKKDLVDKYGFDYKSVKSFEDLEPYLETIKKNEPNITPLYITAAAEMDDPRPENYSVTEIPMVLFDEDKGEYVNALDVDMYKYKRRYEYYQKGYIAKDANVRQESSDGQSGKYAVLPHSGAYSEDGSKSSAYYGFPCVEVLLGTGKYIAQDMLLGGVAISGTSKHPEKAMQILNELWKDPYLSNTMAYGIEGVDYQVVSGTTNEDKSVLPKSGSERTWCVWNNWVGPLFDQWDSTWNSKDALMRMKENNEKADMSKTVGFVVDTSEFEAEIASITQLNSSSKVVLRTGCMTNFDEYIEDYRTRLTEAGIDKLINEMNRQYNEWKKSK